MSQIITSAGTCINHVPKCIKVMMEYAGYDSVNIDIGGGKYDTATNFLAEQRNIRNIVFDPYNRTHNWNINAFITAMKESVNVPITVTVSNVLNVIPDMVNVENVIAQAAELIDRCRSRCKNNLKREPAAFFTVYEGDRSGVPKQTPKGWQWNMRQREFYPLISNQFHLIEERDGVLIATEPKHNPHACWNILGNDDVNEFWFEKGVTL